MEYLSYYVNCDIILTQIFLLMCHRCIWSGYSCTHGQTLHTNSHIQRCHQQTKAFEDSLLMMIFHCQQPTVDTPRPSPNKVARHDYRVGPDTKFRRSKWLVFFDHCASSLPLGNDVIGASLNLISSGNRRDYVSLEPFCLLDLISMRLSNLW